MMKMSKDVKTINLNRLRLITNNIPICTSLLKKNIRIKYLFSLTKEWKEQ